MNSDIFEFSQLDMCTAEEDDDGRKDMVIWIRCAKDWPGKDWMTDMASQGRPSVCKSGPSSGPGSEGPFYFYFIWVKSGPEAEDLDLGYMIFFRSQRWDLARLRWFSLIRQARTGI